MKITANKSVSAEYELYVDGETEGELELMERATAEQPLSFIYGVGMMLPKFEENIFGLATGDKFDFTIEMRTLEMMECCGPELLYEPKERIFGELKRAMMSDRPSIFFSMLAEAGVIAAVILPLGEIWKRQSEDGGEDFSYAMSLLDKTAKLCQRPEVRFASLVRSIGLSLEGREDLLDEIDRTLRLPGVWRRCAEFASLQLPDPSAGKEAAVAVDTLTKLQNHHIGIDGCIAITKAEGTMDSYPFLANSELYLEAMKKVRTELPPGIEGKARGEWIRAKQIEAVSKLLL